MGKDHDIRQAGIRHSFAVTVLLADGAIHHRALAVVLRERANDGIDGRGFRNEIQTWAIDSPFGFIRIPEPGPSGSAEAWSRDSGFLFPRRVVQFSRLTRLSGLGLTSLTYEEGRCGFRCFGNRSLTIR